MSIYLDLIRPNPVQADPLKAAGSGEEQESYQACILLHLAYHNIVSGDLVEKMDRSYTIHIDPSAEKFECFSVELYEKKIC